MKQNSVQAPVTKIAWALTPQPWSYCTMGIGALHSTSFTNNRLWLVLWKALDQKLPSHWRPGRCIVLRLQGHHNLKSIIITKILGF